MTVRVEEPIDYYDKMDNWLLAIRVNYKGTKYHAKRNCLTVKGRGKGTTDYQGKPMN